MIIILHLYLHFYLRLPLLQVFSKLVFFWRCRFGNFWVLLFFLVPSVFFLGAFKIHVCSSSPTFITSFLTFNNCVPNLKNIKWMKCTILYVRRKITLRSHEIPLSTFQKLVSKKTLHFNHKNPNISIIYIQSCNNERWRGGGPRACAHAHTHYIYISFSTI